jgi:hypothetical protein
MSKSRHTLFFPPTISLCASPLAPTWSTRIPTCLAGQTDEPVPVYHEAVDIPVPLAPKKSRNASDAGRHNIERTLRCFILLITTNVLSSYERIQGHYT